MNASSETRHSAPAPAATTCVCNHAALVDGGHIAPPLGCTIHATPSAIASATNTRARRDARKCARNSSDAGSATVNSASNVAAAGVVPGRPSDSMRSAANAGANERSARVA